MRNLRLVLSGDVFYKCHCLPPLLQEALSVQTMQEVIAFLDNWAAAAGAARARSGVQLPGS